MGDPYHLKADKQPDFNTLANNTFVTFGDLDASPTKAWLMLQVDVPKGSGITITPSASARAELYDLKNDPDQLKNVAGQSQFAAAQAAARAVDVRIEADG